MLHRIAVFTIIALVSVGCANVNLHEDPNQSRTVTYGSIGAVGLATVAAIATGDVRTVLAAAAAGGGVGAGAGAIMDRQERELRERLGGTDVHIERIERGHIIVMAPGRMLFDLGQSDLKPQTLNTLNIVSDVFGEYNGQKLLVAGHTDSTGSILVNRPLSMDRARSAADYVNNRGVERNRIMIQGYADEFPLADNDTAEGRAMNRRVTFHILHPSIEMVAQQF